MHIHSIQVSLVKEVAWRGRTIRTGIFKEAISEGQVERAGLIGDDQAEKERHGTEFKAVYSYALEHYDYWQAALKRQDLKPGMFGENLTTVGLNEEAVHIGDVYQFGGCVLQAVQPRYPCLKLGIRMQDDHMITKFIAAQRPGIYWRVQRAGKIKTNDAITCLEKNPKKVKVNDIFSAMRDPGTKKDELKRLLNVDVIDPRWQKKLHERIAVL